MDIYKQLSSESTEPCFANAIQKHISQELCALSVWISCAADSPFLLASVVMEKYSCIYHCIYVTHFQKTLEAKYQQQNNVDDGNINANKKAHWVLVLRIF